MPLLLLSNALLTMRLLVLAMWRRWAMMRSLFPEQSAAVRHSARQKAIKTPRRAGKTRVVLIDIFIDMQTHPNADYAYIALSRESAERIIWKEVEEINAEFDLGGEPVLTRGFWRFPNGCVLYIFGADRPRWMEKFRGVGRFRVVVIDECKSFVIDLQKFVLEVVRPALTGTRGRLWVIGTPGEVPIGFWWEVTQPDPDERDRGYVYFEWDVFDNPHMAEQVREEFDLLKEQYGEEVVEQPWFLREWRGLWVTYSKDLVYHGFAMGRNTTPVYPRKFGEPGEHYQPGADFGHSDAYSEAVLAWNDFDDKVYIVHSWKRGTHPKLGQWKGDPVLLTEVDERMRAQAEKFSGLRQWRVDNSNPQLVKELQDKYRLPVQDAERTHKRPAIEAFNTELHAGQIVVVEPATKACTDEMLTLKKHWVKGGTEWVEHPSQSNDGMDSVLYAWRECRHHRTKALPKDAPMIGSVEWYSMRAKEMRDKRLKGHKKKNSRSFLEM